MVLCVIVNVVSVVVFIMSQSFHLSKRVDTRTCEFDCMHANCTDTHCQRRDVVKHNDILHSGAAHLQRQIHSCLVAYPLSIQLCVSLIVVRLGVFLCFMTFLHSSKSPRTTMRYVWIHHTVVTSQQHVHFLHTYTSSVVYNEASTTTQPKASLHFS